MFVGIIYSIHSARSGQLLHRAHKRIVNNESVHRKEQHTSGMRFRKNSDFGNFEVGINFRDRRAHCYPRRIASVLFRGAIRFGT